MGQNTLGSQDMHSAIQQAERKPNQLTRSCKADTVISLAFVIARAIHLTVHKSSPTDVASSGTSLWSWQSIFLLRSYGHSRQLSSELWIGDF